MNPLFFVPEPKWQIISSHPCTRVHEHGFLLLPCSYSAEVSSDVWLWPTLGTKFPTHCFQNQARRVTRRAAGVDRVVGSVPSHSVFSGGTTSISSWRCMVMGPTGEWRSKVTSILFKSVHLEVSTTWHCISLLCFLPFEHIISHFIIYCWSRTNVHIWLTKPWISGKMEK